MRATGADTVGGDSPGRLFVRAVTEQRAFLHGAAACTFLLATLAAFAAQNSDRPRSAAVIYVLGVTLVGGIEGLWGGLLAALLASLIYNFFLSAPTFQFSITTVEELTPLIAFNLCAAGSGLLTGWLKDRALAAELANRRLESLLNVSKQLQAAVRLADLPAIVEDHAVLARGEAELYLVENGHAKSASSTRHDQLADALLNSGTDRLGRNNFIAIRLTMQSERSCILVVPRGTRIGDQYAADEAFINLLSLAVERCLLLEELGATELLRRSEEFKTTLLSSVSHDLRTPLSAIAASASSLEQFGDDLPRATWNDLLATIREQCGRLNRYTTNLLNLGRLQSGLDETRFTDCDVLEALGRAIAQVRELGCGHVIEKRYAVTAAPVRADPVLLEQVFFNIIENAARYSPADAAIRVEVHGRDAFIRVDVSDGGPGIAEEDLDRVFDRFYRGRSSQGEGGSGLGLSISKGFVEAFGGTVKARRSERGGTVVSVALPQLTGPNGPI